MTKHKPNEYSILMDGTVAVDTKRGIALFSLCDLPLIESCRLRFGGSNYRYIIARRGRKEHLAHRLILQPGPGLEVDHKNRDPSDNRRENLRVALRKSNAHNSIKISPTTGYRGVQTAKGRFRAHICFEMKKRHIGLFETAEEAARAYDNVALALHGDFAVLNFPNEAA
jgi:hypothetical protein